MSPIPTVSVSPVTAPTVTGPGVTGPATVAGSATGTTTGSSTTAGGTTATGNATSAASTSTAATALSLLGLGTDDASASALSSILGTGTGSSTTDSVTLTKILELLEKQQAQADSAAKTATAAQTAKAAEKVPVASGGELIRFTVNGYSITATTTNLVSSILTKDGSFLLTGDRGYSASGQKITETFYLLCRKNADGTYRLQADVSQNPVNANSYLYQLARRSPVKGILTGDLLVFRTDDPSWSLNLVIRIINPSVVKTSGR